MFHGKANSEQGTHEPSVTFKTEEDAALQQKWEMQLYLAAANKSSILGQSLLIFRRKPPILEFSTVQAQNMSIIQVYNENMS